MNKNQEKPEMQKLSKLIYGCSPQAPCIGVNGYAGEQDGTSVLTTEVLYFYSRKHADEKYPEGVPSYLKTNWCKRTQRQYHDGQSWYKEWTWEIVLYCYSDQPFPNDGNPFSMM